MVYVTKGNMYSLDFKLIHEQVSHNRNDWGTHNCPTYLFKILTLEGERYNFEPEIQQHDDVKYEHGS